MPRLARRRPRQLLLSISSIPTEALQKPVGLVFQSALFCVRRTLVVMDRDDVGRSAGVEATLCHILWGDELWYARFNVSAARITLCERPR